MLEWRLRELESKINDCAKSHEIYSINGKIDTLERKTRDAEGKIDTLEREKYDLQEQYNRLRDDLRELEIQVDGLASNSGFKAIR